MAENESNTSGGPGWGGALAGLAAIITAITGLLAVLNQFSGSNPIAAHLLPPTTTTHYPQSGVSWTNSLGMKFVPVADLNILYGVWDVRVKDFQAYIQDSGYQQIGGINVLKVHNDNNKYTTKWELDPNASWQYPGFDQEPDHPVVGVSWNEAKAFCAWLTDKERKAGLISSSQQYRLPTDSEWSTVAGDGTYAWGNAWPPPPAAGNFMDQAWAASFPAADWTVTPINDGYPRTSPVGKFQPNQYGVYDVCGNVSDWCEDWFHREMNSEDLRTKYPGLNDDGGGQTYRVIRGSSWGDVDNVCLSSSYRRYFSPGDRYDYLGFRCVLVLSNQ